MTWVYENTADNTARYTLGTLGERPLVCIGLNPSTAIPDRLDPTLTRVRAVAGLNEYDSFLMLNVYPLRSTDPEGLPGDLDPEAVKANAAQISAALEGATPDVGWPGAHSLPSGASLFLSCWNCWTYLCSRTRVGSRTDRSARTATHITRCM